MDSNDSFSLAMDTADMPGFTGLTSHHGGHPGPLPPGHPHQLPHYPDHYDQPNLPPHQPFNCGEFKLHGGFKVYISFVYIKLSHTICRWDG